MKRWHEDFTVTYREWKKHHRSHVESNVESSVIYECGIAVGLRRDIWDVDCPCDTQIGRFRKRHAGDCGITRCYLCHYDKYPKRDLTYQELCANLKLKEGIEEYWDDRIAVESAGDCSERDENECADYSFGNAA